MRLIDADAYKKYLDENWIVANYNAIDAQPIIDAVEIVRCKDCRFFSMNNKHPWGICSNWDDITYPDGFCSYAERKTTDVNQTI